MLLFELHCSCVVCSRLPKYKDTSRIVAPSKFACALCASQRKALTKLGAQGPQASLLPQSFVLGAKTFLSSAEHAQAAYVFHGVAGFVLVLVVYFCGDKAQALARAVQHAISLTPTPTHTHAHAHAHAHTHAHIHTHTRTHVHTHTRFALLGRFCARLLWALCREREWDKCLSQFQNYEANSSGTTRPAAPSHRLDPGNFFRARVYRNGHVNPRESLVIVAVHADLAVQLETFLKDATSQ